MGIIFHRCHDNMRKYDERALCNLIIESLVRFMVKQYIPSIIYLHYIFLYSNVLWYLNNTFQDCYFIFYVQIKNSICTFYSLNSGKCLHAKTLWKQLPTL